MTKIDSLRRILFPCFYPSPTTSTTTTNAPIKRRLSTSLRDDIEDPPEFHNSSTSTSPQANSNVVIAPSRPSKTMVIGTVFGTRRGHVFFCFQNDRLSDTKPLLFLELSIPTHQLVKEMQCGFVRIALESSKTGSVSCPLRNVPVWNVSCNGKKIGFALKRKVSEYQRMMLKTMQSMTVGAGVIPAGFGAGGAEEDKEEVMYMRANYEHVVGSANSESFHLINLDEGSGQELSVFLIRFVLDEETACSESCKKLKFWLKMLEGKAVVSETDMPELMQSHVMELAYQALDLHEVSDCQSIAHYIKQNFDEAYGPAWHCVVGKDFGSCITHLCGSFIFFRVEMMEFLIFKDGKDESKEEAIAVLQKSQDQNHS